MVLAGFLVFFGVMTVVAGGAVLLDVDGMRAEAGHIVPMVLWMNFLAGFVYIAAGAGLFRRAAWVPQALLAALLLLLAATAGFLLHRWQGLPYEPRTARALPVRILVTALLYAAARYFNRTAVRHEADGHPR